MDTMTGIKLLLFLTVLATYTTNYGVQVALGLEISAQRQQSARRDPSKPQTTLNLEEALAALELGDLTAARRLLQQVIVANPNDPVAHTYLGVLADRENDLTSAERHFADAVRLAPRDAGTRNNFGALLVRRGRASEAADQFAEALRLDPRNTNALINLAQVRFARGTPEDLRVARDLFARAHEERPGVDTARALVVNSLRLNDKPSAMQYYRDYARLVGAHSGADAARAELGQALLEGDLAPEAIEELTAALATDTDNIPALIILTRAYLKLNDIPAAGRALEAAVARGLEDARLYAMLAEVYERAGRYENAIPAMRLAVLRDPKNEAWRFRYGMLLTDSKAPAAAIIRVQESLATFPRSPRLWLALGVAQQAAGKNDDATKSFARAVELDAKFAPAYAYLGATYDERGQYSEAVSYYQKTIEIDPNAAIAYYLAAEALLKINAGNLERVEQHLRRAIALDPGFAQARASFGKLLLRTDRADEAVTHLRRAVEIEPKFAQAHYQLGRALQRLKRADEAQLALSTFKQLNDSQKKESEDKRRELVRRLADVRF